VKFLVAVEFWPGLTTDVAVYGDGTNVCGAGIRTGPEAMVCCHGGGVDTSGIGGGGGG